ncbi:uncharacterized protein LOC110809039 [Carica papaya]|uniref:uncharacterized protein LOC110809039 n=1 Tax=Carica papaya TaxID=3649 RepID=UPI000B8CA4B3|nr:uncharacterized protein LOC110809039 [Carica papaya]
MDIPPGFDKETRPNKVKLTPFRLNQFQEHGLADVNSQPFMRWRDRFLFCAEAINKAQVETSEIKGHYLNVTAGTCEEMIKRAVFARELGAPIIMHDYLSWKTSCTYIMTHCTQSGKILPDQIY